ncbi:MAG: hypothetical protein PHR20_05270 [Bacteroidales bacterium]|nr:hypothetical protein [Bacteroidales bacterium]
MKYLLNLTALSISVLILFSCNHYEEYPIEPQIEYNGYTLLSQITETDTIPVKGVIKIGFTDGDGDIGLYDYDTVAPYDYNLFIAYYELHNNVWTQVVNADGDTVNFNGRIPIITPDGSNKNIKGTIYDTVLLNTFSSFDTVKYVISIRDRALHQSNEIETPAIKTSL